MEKVTISIIMAEYNTNPDYLRASIESMLNQTYRSFELIIVLDGPNPGSEAVIKSYSDERIRLLYNEKNEGLIYSLNKAIASSRGQYLVRMDTDDIATRDRIEITYDFIKSNPQYDVVASRVMEFSGDKDSGILGTPGEKDARSIMRGEPFIHPSVIMSKGSFLKSGGYPDYKRAEDLALWCQMLLDGARLYVLEDVLLRYRVNPEDYSKRKLRHRSGELRARMNYYPKMGATWLDYMRILRFIISGTLPNRVVQVYRQKFRLKQVRGE